MASCLVTGAAGFIGSHAAQALAAAGHRVVGIDCFDPMYSRAIKEENLREALAGEAWAFAEADLRDADRITEVMSSYGVDTVLHLAARAGVRPSLRMPAEYMDLNVTATATLLEAARTAGVAKLVYASSSSVYGADNSVPFREDQPLRSPMSPYAASKVAGEALCHAFHHVYGLQTTCLRFFTVYGPRQRPDLAINFFVRRMAAGEPLPIFGDGTTSRDYTYIGDIVRGVLAALHGDWGFEIINLGSGRTISLSGLVQALEQVMGVPAILDYQPRQPGDMVHTFADISRANQLLGWRPEVSLHDGLAAFVEWWRGREAGGAGA